MSEDDSERRQRGLKMFEEVYGGVVPVPPPEHRGAFFWQTIDQLFSETWSRPNMSIRDRRLVALGAVAALGETEMFEIQLRAAIRKGELTEAQVEDLVLFLPAYISYPRTSKILAISQKIFAEMKAAAKRVNKYIESVMFSGVVSGTDRPERRRHCHADIRSVRPRLWDRSLPALCPAA